MESVIDQLRSQFSRELPGCRLEVDAPRKGGRLFGVLEWDGFDGSEQIERQRRVWGIIRSTLTPQDQERIAGLLTFTPTEREDDPEMSSDRSRTPSTRRRSAARSRVARGASADQGVVKIDSDLRALFPDAAAVNEALRTLARLRLADPAPIKAKSNGKRRRAA